MITGKGCLYLTCNVSNEKSCPPKQHGLGHYYRLLHYPKECYMFITKEPANVSFLLNHMKTQVNALSDPNSLLRDLVNQWFGSWGSWWKGLLLIYLFSCMCLYHCCSVCLPYSQIAAKWTTSILMESLLTAYSTLWKKEGRWDCKSQSLGEVIERTWLPVDPRAVPRELTVLTPSPSLECTFCPPFLQSEPF